MMDTHAYPQQEKIIKRLVYVLDERCTCHVIPSEVVFQASLMKLWCLAYPVLIQDLIRKRLTTI